MAIQEPRRKLWPVLGIHRNSSEFQQSEIDRIFLLNPLAQEYGYSNRDISWKEKQPQANLEFVKEIFGL